MNRLFFVLPAIVFCLGLVACDKHAKGDETLYSVSADDAAMNAIIDDARKTVSEFIAVLKHPQPNQASFSVKFPFETDPGSETSVEHIWLGNIVEKNSKYYATIDNDPFYIRKMKLGDTVPVDMSQISDWMYVENGYLVGGKSLVFFYKKMNADEKKQFLEESGFLIKE